MTTSIKLSKRESAVLTVISMGGGKTGMFIARDLTNQGLDTSPQGAHQTAASLVRKGLVTRTRDDRGLVYYVMTVQGRDVLEGAGRT